MVEAILGDSRLMGVIITMAYCLFTREATFYMIVVVTSSIMTDAILKVIYKQYMFFIKDGV